MNSINLTNPTHSCPLCGRSNRLAQLSPTVNRYIRATPIPVVGKLAYYFCLCGLYYAADYMSEEDTHEYYAGGAYRECTSGSPGISDGVIKDEITHAANITPLIYGRVRECITILDIGCSSGVLLEQLHNHYHCMALGVEWNWQLLEHCRKERGFTCWASIDKVGSNNKIDHFDLVILSHVLEHTLQPIPLLRDIYNLLDGLLFIQVPLMMPGVPHPLVFTESSAVWMVERAGYKVVCTQEIKTPDAHNVYFTIWAGKAE